MIKIYLDIPGIDDYELIEWPAFPRAGEYFTFREEVYMVSFVEHEYDRKCIFITLEKRLKPEG